MSIKHHKSKTIITVSPIGNSLRNIHHDSDSSSLYVSLKDTFIENWFIHIHSFWPSLLKVPSFLVEFITPIVRVSDFFI